jgi:hypothetical protein
MRLQHIQALKVVLYLYLLLVMFQTSFGEILIYLLPKTAAISWKNKGLSSHMHTERIVVAFANSGKLAMPLNIHIFPGVE